MTEPARTRVHAKRDEWRCTLQRYVELPDGSLELQDIPLTPEDFLDPQVGDKWLQGRLHREAVLFLYEMLTRRFYRRPDILVLSELKHLMEPRLGPAPDISMIFGLEDPDFEMEIYDVPAVGIPPSLVIEVLSPSDRLIRKLDEVDKVQLYERMGAREYLLLDLPRQGNRRRLSWLGYRLDRAGRYTRIEPDFQARIHSETTGLLFGTDPTETWIQILDARTGQRLLTPAEEEKGRKQAEAEVARLRAERAHLRGEA